MSRPPSLDGRAVQWTDIVDNHNNSALMKKQFAGHIVSHSWTQAGVCQCLVVGRDGAIHIKPATALVITHAPDALPHSKFTQ